MTVSPFRTLARRERLERGPHIAVLAREQSGAIVVRRLTAAGYRRVSVVPDADAITSAPPEARADIVVALLEPALLSRKQLYTCDLTDIALLGLTAHRRHRVWAELLPLQETIWLYAAPSQYRKALQELCSARETGATFRLDG